MHVLGDQTRVHAGAESTGENDDVQIRGPIVSCRCGHIPLCVAARIGLTSSGAPDAGVRSAPVRREELVGKDRA